MYNRKGNPKSIYAVMGRVINSCFSSSKASWQAIDHSQVLSLCNRSFRGPGHYSGEPWHKAVVVAHQTRITPKLLMTDGRRDVPDGGQQLEVQLNTFSGDRVAHEGYLVMGHGAFRGLELQASIPHAIEDLSQAAQVLFPGTQKMMTSSR